jgi:RNA polymerase sigma-70 factor (ECF subfamily)
LLLAHENFSQFQGTSGEELLAWTRRILQNCVFAAHRRYAGTQKRDLTIEVRIEGDQAIVPTGDRLIDQNLTPSSHAMAAEERRAIDKALASLPPNYQLAIRMRYWERRSLDEIGAKLGRSPEAARKLYVRAVRRFVKNWQGRG